MPDSCSLRSMVDEWSGTMHDGGGAGEALAREIKRRRHAAGLSQPQLAQRIGYTRQYVSLAERTGQNLPSPSLVQALDRALEAQGALIALRNQAKNEQHGKRRQISDALSVTGSTASMSTTDRTLAPDYTYRKRSPIAPQKPDVPSREEMAMAAEESALFGNWSAITNVDQEVLDQMDADVSNIAHRYLVDPPATVFNTALAARRQVFELISNKQAPQLTVRLYKVAGQLCGLLAQVSMDHGYAHAANTHARTALRCLELGEYPELIGYVRWVQSNVAYWNGRLDEAAQLIESALDSAPATGTARLRLSSQRARIEAKRQSAADVHAALSLAEASISLPRNDPSEEGVFLFTTGKAAYYASEAYRQLGDPVSLDAAVQWAQTSITELSMSPDTSPPLIAAAHFDLAQAYLAKGDLDAVTENLTHILRDTADSFRTVPIIGRAREIREQLAISPVSRARPMVAMRDDLEQFCLSPATAPPELSADSHE
jgi:transcriptional regulator with XRE-family HTH domain